MVQGNPLPRETAMEEAFEAVEEEIEVVHEVVLEEDVAVVVEIEITMTDQVNQQPTEMVTFPRLITFKTPPKTTLQKCRNLLLRDLNPGIERNDQFRRIYYLARARFKLYLQPPTHGILKTKTKCSKLNSKWVIPTCNRYMKR